MLWMALLCEELKCTKLTLLVLTMGEIKRSAKYGHPVLDFNNFNKANNIEFIEYGNFKVICLSI